MKKNVNFLIIRVDGVIYDAYPLENDNSSNVNPVILCDHISNASEVALKKRGWVAGYQGQVQCLYIECEAYHLEGEYANLSIMVENRVIDLGK